MGLTKTCNCTDPLIANRDGDIICGGCGDIANPFFPKHDPHTLRVEEHTDTISRNDFVCSYMEATHNVKLY